MISRTWIWSRTDLTEFREIPRSADGPPQMRPTLRFLLLIFCFFSSPSSTTSALVIATVPWNLFFIPKNLPATSLRVWLSFSVVGEAVTSTLSTSTSPPLLMRLLIDKLTPMAVDDISKEIFSKSLILPLRFLFRWFAPRTLNWKDRDKQFFESKTRRSTREACTCHLKSLLVDYLAMITNH